MDKFRIRALLSALSISIIFSGCLNTTLPQFSENIKNAKANKTFVKEYVCDTTQTSPISIGEAWVEKVWYYESFGNKTIENSRTLYIRYVANKPFQIKDYWNISLKETPQNTTALFETYSGHKGIGEDKIWYEIDFRKDVRALPDTLRFNIYDKQRSDTIKIGELVLIVKRI